MRAGTVQRLGGLLRYFNDRREMETGSKTPPRAKPTPILDPPAGSNSGDHSAPAPIPPISGHSPSRDHLARLGGSDEGELGRSNAVLVMLRDLKLVNSHLASIGYALIEPREGVTARLMERPSAPVTL